MAGTPILVQSWIPDTKSTCFRASYLDLNPGCPAPELFTSLEPQFPPLQDYYKDPVR